MVSTNLFFLLSGKTAEQMFADNDQDVNGCLKSAEIKEWMKTHKIMKTQDIPKTRETFQMDSVLTLAVRRLVKEGFLAG